MSDSESDDFYTDNDDHSDSTMDEAQLARKHELWFTEGRDDLQNQLQNIEQAWSLCISLKLLMILTLDRSLFESLQEALDNLQTGTMDELRFSLNLFRWDNACDDCRNPPSDEALLTTATELFRIADGVDSINVVLSYASTGFASSVLAACSRLTSISLVSCCLATTNLQAIFSITTLRYLDFRQSSFSDSEAINAFCLGLEASSLQSLYMLNSSFRPEQEAQAATSLARSKTLVCFTHIGRARPSFLNRYCVALANNFDTKLEQLDIAAGNASICLYRNGGLDTATGIDTATVVKIRNLLKWNRQRQACPPLFASIDNAETDATRKQCLVEALEAVDTPVLFEYITANENNLIELIQRLGRSRKRQRDD